MKAVAINGSSRRDGNTAAMVRRLFEELKAEGIDTEMIQLAGKEIHACRACYACFTKKDNRCAQDDDIVNECIGKITAADAVILASPTYFADCSGQMKCFIDRAGFVARATGSLRRKVGAAVVAVRRAGAIHAFDSLNHFFTINEMIVVGSSYWNIGMGREPGQVEQDAEAMETMSVLGRNMAWVMKKLAG